MPRAPRLTDIQYVNLVCRSPIPEIAVHTGQNTAKVTEELDRTPTPPELRPITTR